MNIVPGTDTDIDAILIIVQQTVAEMQTYGNNQWDETYPLRDRFIQDLENHALYVAKASRNRTEDSEIMAIQGFIVIDREEPDEYNTINWRSDRPFLVIHRLAVSIHHRSQGIASALEAFACQLATAQNIAYIKVDTHNTNQRMQQFLERKGYIKTGETLAKGKDKPFYYYDKLL